MRVVMCGELLASIPAVMLRVVSVWTVVVESLPGGLRKVRQLTSITPCLLVIASAVVLVGLPPCVMLSMCTFLLVRVLFWCMIRACSLLASGSIRLLILMSE